jgi:ABC-type lipoprotein export system ATPase subunit
VIVVTHAEDVAQHARRRIKLRDGHLLSESLAPRREPQ